MYIFQFLFKFGALLILLVLQNKNKSLKKEFKSFKYKIMIVFYLKRIIYSKHNHKHTVEHSFVKVSCKRLKI